MTMTVAPFAPRRSITAEQDADVEGVQADAGLVEDEQRIGLLAAEFGCELEPLGLAAGQRRGVLAEGQVAEPEVDEGPQLLRAPSAVLGVRQRLCHGEAEQFGQGQAVRRPPECPVPAGA